MDASLSTITYFPRPRKIECTVSEDTNLNSLNWWVYTAALGALALYAPKTFLATSVVILGYQVVHFNELVQSEDKSKHQEILKWTITACQVMGCIGVAFCLRSLPSFWSTLVSIRHLHLFHASGHLVKAGVIFGIGGLLSGCTQRSEELADKSPWVEMEDYLENYPVELKKEISSSYWNQLRFYLAALLTDPILTGVISATNIAYIQFLDEDFKGAVLRIFFNHPNSDEWPIAVHLLQQLPLQRRLSLGEVLTKAASSILSEEELKKLPDEVKVILLNERLKGFKKIPSEREENYAAWDTIVTQFHELEKDQRWDLGEPLCRLLQIVPDESLTQIPADMRYAALRFCVLDVASLEGTEPYAMPFAKLIFRTLSEELQVEFGTYLHGLITSNILSRDRLPAPMQAKLPLNN